MTSLRCNLPWNYLEIASLPSLGSRFFKWIIKLRGNADWAPWSFKSVSGALHLTHRKEAWEWSPYFTRAEKLPENNDGLHVTHREAASKENGKEKNEGILEYLNQTTAFLFSNIPLLTKINEYSNRWESRENSLSGNVKCTVSVWCSEGRKARRQWKSATKHRRLLGRRGSRALWSYLTHTHTHTHTHTQIYIYIHSY